MPDGCTCQLPDLSQSDSTDHPQSAGHLSYGTIIHPSHLTITICQSVKTPTIIHPSHLTITICQSIKAPHHHPSLSFYLTTTCQSIETPHHHPSLSFYLTTTCQSIETPHHHPPLSSSPPPPHTHTHTPVIATLYVYTREPQFPRLK